MLAIDYMALSSLKDQRSVLPPTDMYSRYGFAFPACRTPTRNTICRLIECLVQQQGIPRRPGVHFTAESLPVFSGCGVHCLHHILQHPQQLAYWRDESFKVTTEFLVCTHKLGRNICKSSSCYFVFHQLVVMDSHVTVHII